MAVSSESHSIEVQKTEAVSCLGDWACPDSLDWLQLPGSSGFTMDGIGLRVSEGHGVGQEMVVNEIRNLVDAAWLWKSNNARSSLSFDATELKFGERNIGGARSSKIQEISISELFWVAKSKAFQVKGNELDQLCSAKMMGKEIPGEDMSTNSDRPRTPNRRSEVLPRIPWSGWCQLRVEVLGKLWLTDCLWQQWWKLVSVEWEMVALKVSAICG